MERKDESKEQTERKKKQGAEEIRIAKITYGSRKLVDCMEAVIRLHGKK